MKQTTDCAKPLRAPDEEMTEATATNMCRMDKGRGSRWASGDHATGTSGPLSCWCPHVKRAGTGRGVGAKAAV